MASQERVNGRYKRQVGVAPAAAESRDTMVNRHLQVLRDMRRLHEGRHRAILARHEKEADDLVARHRHLSPPGKPSTGRRPGRGS
jgi:hypothetical protein